MIWSLVLVIFDYGVLVDYVAVAPVQFLRLYITLFSAMGVFLLIVSVFRAFAQFAYIGMAFSIITILHAYIIMQRNGGLSNVTPEMWSYFAIGLVAINIAGFYHLCHV